MFAPVSKLALRLDPASADTVIRKALRTAVAERPGAVHLTVSADAWSMPAEGQVSLPPLAPAAASVDVHGDGDPVRTLTAARRPVILAGIAALRCAAGPELVRLAELAGIPVVVSPMAKGVFPEDHPYFAGVLDMAGYRVLWDLLAGADLILAAGFDPVELISPWSLATPVVHLDTTPNTDQVYASACELTGHVGAILGWLSAQWAGEPRWAATEVAAHRARLHAAWLAGRAEGRLNPSDVVAIAREAAPPGTILTTDVGSHKIMAGQVWQASEPRSVLIPNGLSAMGFGVPAAIAARRTRPGRPVIALVGDGGFAMAGTGMRIASALGVPVTVVVFGGNSLNPIEPTVGVVGVPDPRLAELAKLYDSARIVPASVRFTDIAGLVRGASAGQGLGNQFLAHIRETDAICQVVRVFADPDVTHVDGDVSPERDIETVVTELILADLQTLEKALPRLAKETKFAKDPE